MYSLDFEDYLSFSVHGGGDSAGVAGSVDDLLTGIEALLVMSPAQIFAELMPGIAAMENFHPLFVHFPIALLSLFFVLDALGSLSRNLLIRDVASWFLYLGTLFAGITVALGLHAADTVAHGDDVHMIMEHHEHLGISVLSLALVLSAWRMFARDGISGSWNTLHLSMAGILAVILAFTADLGGLMVYGYGVAVAPVTAANQDAAMVHQHSGGAAEQHALQTAPETDAVGDAVPAEVEPVVEPVAPQVHTHADGSQHVHKHNH
jgi:uncharacterized membrane protein